MSLVKTMRKRVQETAWQSRQNFGNDAPAVKRDNRGDLDFPFMATYSIVINSQYFDKL